MSKAIELMREKLFNNLENQDKDFVKVDISKDNIRAIIAFDTLGCHGIFNSAINEKGFTSMTGILYNKQREITSRFFTIETNEEGKELDHKEFLSLIYLVYNSVDDKPNQTKKPYTEEYYKENLTYLKDGYQVGFGMAEMIPQFKSNFLSNMSSLPERAVTPTEQSEQTNQSEPVSKVKYLHDTPRGDGELYQSNQKNVGNPIDTSNNNEAEVTVPIEILNQVKATNPALIHMDDRAVVLFALGTYLGQATKSSTMHLSNGNSLQQNGGQPVATPIGQNPLMKNISPDYRVPDR